MFVEIEGKRIQALREERELSQRALARQAGIARETLRRIESGDDDTLDVRRGTLRRLGSVLDVDYRSLGTPHTNGSFARPTD